jgi:hypothetical protein
VGKEDVRLDKDRVHSYVICTCRSMHALGKIYEAFLPATHTPRSR